MMTRKNSEQKNVRVNKDMYTEREIERLVHTGYVCWLDEALNEHFNMPDWWEYDKTEFIVFLEDTKEIKVIYNNEYGFYETVVILNTGLQISVTL